MAETRATPEVITRAKTIQSKLQVLKKRSKALLRKTKGVRVKSVSKKYSKIGRNPHGHDEPF